MHGDNDTNIGCPNCGALHWYCTTNEADEDIGKCDNCFHDWPIDFDELDKQIHGDDLSARPLRGAQLRDRQVPR